MTVFDLGSLHPVTDPHQARLLTEPRSKTFFKPFLAREQSAKEAADAIECSLNAMLYRVKVMVDAGLIRLVGTRPRAGRAVKVYRSVHDAYFVPFALTPYATLEERLWVQGRPIFANLIRAYASALRASELYGHAILRDENGAVWTTDRLPDATPQGLPTVYSDTVTPLSNDEALEIAQALRDILVRGVRPRPTNSPKSPYLLMLALLPIEEPQPT
jgi:DNA-binding Lrp family transcriptional regulator